ncbi:hypothetical protein FH966_01425 [Lentibacillus cibarius]|uniref:PilN domain-containing protein n=1 Tax=Lentibacillus cibarius TaxID=2583219 RepID=A0A549YF32_9BACI|nr:hypothetical protein [Lentibacillus cibarius]TMN21583.1 hypothetical protein FFL34_05275 [Lentibacillus cibarius]TRM10486.1 hypothetical protein FH966_01425 [Lentibacillus cibarius]
MNTEINFLEKERKQLKMPLVLFLIFLLLVIAVITVLLVQRNGLTHAIDVQQKEMAVLENQVSQLEGASGTVQQLEQTKEALASIEAQTVPRVALYEQVLDMLRDPGQMEDFAYNSGEQFQLEAAFDTLSAVSDYIGKLLQQPYVLDAKMSDISKAGDGYDASLVVTFDSGVLREEMSADAD